MKKPNDKEVLNVSELKPDPSNARRRTPRNLGMIQNSLQEVGAARSIVIDENNVVLAGNGVIEAGSQAGFERVIVVDASGRDIIAVRRTGLSDEQKRRLALFDNKTNETSEWDQELLRTFNDEGSLRGMFNEDEIKDIIASADKIKTELRELQVIMPPRFAWVAFGIPLLDYPKATTLIEQLQKIPGAIVEIVTSDSGEGEDAAKEE